MAKNHEQSGQENKDQRHGSAGRRGLGSSGRQSESNGPKVQDRLTSENSERVYRGKEDFVNGGEAGLGKILSQLRELQRSHLAYVEAHEERLQSRLEAAREHHDKVLGQMNVLEQEILVLLGEVV